MTNAQTFVARVALSAPGAAAIVLLPAVSRFYRGGSERFDRLLLAVFAISRLGLFVLVFQVLHLEVRGDVPGFYVPEARAAMQGLLPEIGFFTSYAPLHAYLDGICLAIWNSPKSIVLLAIAGELGALALWLRVARAFAREEVRRTAGLLMLASPLSMQFVTIDGQDTVLLALAAAAAIYLVLRSRPVASGAVFGVSIAAIKFLPLLYAPLFFASLRRRWVWAVGVAGSAVLGYGFFFLKHSDLLYPLKAEGSRTTASDLPYVLGLVSGLFAPNRVYDALVLLLLAAAYLWMFGQARERNLGSQTPEVKARLLVFGMALLMMIVIAFSKKSWPNYLMAILFNLCLLPAFRSAVQRGCFALVQMLGCTSHSYWASFLNQADAAGAHHLLIEHDRTAILLVPQQILLVAGYLWLIVLLLRELRGRHKLLL